MGEKSGNVIVGGHINTNNINSTHRQIKSIVDSYREVNKEVNTITNQLKDEWVGKGRNEFESQYNLLIRKIDDFGDTLQDIFDHLVEAEADYETADNDLKQDFRAAMEG